MVRLASTMGKWSGLKSGPPMETVIVEPIVTLVDGVTASVGKGSTFRGKFEGGHHSMKPAVKAIPLEREEDCI